MDEMDWEPPPEDGVLRADAGLRVEIARPSAALRLTGDLKAALAGAPGLRMAGYAPEGPAPEILRIARDKALVLAEPEALERFGEGWNDDGYAASRCDGAWAMLHVTGPAARTAMSMVAAIDLDAPSPSAAMSLNGAVGGLAARTSEGWTLFVPVPLLAFHAASLLALPAENET